MTEEEVAESIRGLTDEQRACVIKDWVWAIFEREVKKAMAIAGANGNAHRALYAAVEKAKDHICQTCSMPGHSSGNCWVGGQFYYECKMLGKDHSVAYAVYKV